LDRLKQRHGNRDFELIGYSGGATLALLLAVQRDDIAQIQTLAGNLSPRLWAGQLRLSPLTGSLEPLDYAERLRKLPQRHFSGATDSVIPPQLQRAYAERLGPSDCLTLRVLPTDHDNWLEHWRHWRDRPIECKSSSAAA